MKYSRLLAIVVITFVLASGQGYARTPDRALTNPLFLTEADDSGMLYVGYLAGTKQFLVSYAEYDEFANGYGAFIIQTAGPEEDGRLSFVAVKEFGNADVGIGMHRVAGTMNLDLGMSYDYEKVSVRAAVHEVPLTRWEEGKDQIGVSLGGSVEVTDSVVVGLDVRPGDKWKYDVHSSIAFTPSIATRVNVGFQGPKWSEVGTDVWYSHKRFLIHVGYTLNSDLHSDFRLGLGFSF